MIWRRPSAAQCPISCPRVLAPGPFSLCPSHPWRHPLNAAAPRCGALSGCPGAPTCDGWSSGTAPAPDSEGQADLQPRRHNLSLQWAGSPEVGAARRCGDRREAVSGQRSTVNKKARPPWTASCTIRPGSAQGRHPPSTVHHPPSTVLRPPSAIHRPPSSIGHPPSSVLHPPSSVLHPPSSILHPPSSIRHPPSAWGRRRPACSQKPVMVKSKWACLPKSSWLPAPPQKQ